MLRALGREGVAMAKGNLGRWLLVAAIGAAVATILLTDLRGYLTLDALKSARGALEARVAAQPVASGGVYFGLYVVVTALSIPGAAIMTLAGGALFGLLWGLVIVSFASTIGATLAFLAARFLLRDAIQARYGERLRAINDGVAKDGAFYLFTLRLVPLFPFFLVNLLMGLTPIRTRTFYVVSQLGMLPGTIAYVFAGTQLAKVQSVKDVLSPGLVAAFVVLGLLPLVLRWWTRWLAARRVYHGHARPASFDYDLVVIGAGAAGLVSSYIGATLKARVALIEKHKMGGDCLNTGCVPSKALLRSAKLLAEARDSAKYGIRRLDAEFRFADVMERVQQVIRKVEPHDSVERYAGLGVDCIRGAARLVSPWHVEVDGQRRLSARHIVLATGARPLVPRIAGLDAIPYFTSDTIWSTRELPKRLLVLGGGPIGCELAQAFARLGSAVTIAEMLPRLLPREDADAAAEVAQAFERERIRVAAAHKALAVERDGDAYALVCEHAGRQVRLPFDTLLVALGRKANVEGFGLEELGVALTDKGTIAADGLMRTNFPNISVCGDVAGPYQFTHVAAPQAWYAAVNALLAPWWSFTADYRVIPWCTFTDPEVARVGLSEQEANEQGIAVEVTKYGLDDLDRAIADSVDHGFVKVLTPPGKDTVLGATIVGAHAGELLAEFVLAMKHGIGLDKILGTIHSYPTLMEANKYAAGVWKKAHAPQRALAWAERYFAWRRGGRSAPAPVVDGD
jgi:pyruvate/2-oxoglutarate dehydrogenase complex dihydrolipoamide dehydrogenase (E3) component/uncharacterized membrane protein YdjX (TVP38/TMEM64 family)